MTRQKEKKEKRKRSKVRQRSTLEILRELRKKSAAIHRKAPEDLARRQKLERNPAEWLRFYLAEVYPEAFSEVHLRMIESACRVIESGGGICVAAPRGFGKTSVLWGVALWGVLSGACRFPVVAGWSEVAARRLLRRWLSVLSTNQKIIADYPDICIPFTESLSSVQLRTQYWADTGEKVGAEVHLMENMIVLPNSIGAIGAASVCGNARGLFATLVNGTTIRPDVLLLDDPQDRETAMSAVQTRKVIEKIESDLFNLAGPNRRLAIMAAVTVIAPGDVAEYFLQHQDFEAIRCAQVVEWPAGFWDKQSETRRLWEQWNIERLEGLTAHDGGERAKKFYIQHKEKMIAGMKVAWEEKYDSKRDVDAYFSAMWDYYRLGHDVFFAERQNAPVQKILSVYELTPEIVATHTTQHQRYTIPEAVKIIVAGVDINYYGLHYVVAGFANDHTAWILDYGRIDRNGYDIVDANTPESEAKKNIFQALVQCGQLFSGMQLNQNGVMKKIQTWLIDAGYMPDVVRRYVESTARPSGIQIYSARGMASEKYRPNPRNCIGTPREQCHMAETTVAGRHIVFNACYWREISQRAWLGAVESPGSVNLFAGRHAEFAEHVTREKLVEKLQGEHGTYWRWHTQPGRHDWGDALTMCYVASAWMGIGTMQAVQSFSKRRVVRYIEKRKPKIKTEE
jgi:hypothetical protein